MDFFVFWVQCSIMAEGLSVLAEVWGWGIVLSSLPKLRLDHLRIMRSRWLHVSLDPCWLRGAKPPPLHLLPGAANDNQSWEGVTPQLSGFFAGTLASRWDTGQGWVRLQGLLCCSVSRTQP